MNTIEVLTERLYFVDDVLFDLTLTDEEKIRILCNRFIEPAQAEAVRRTKETKV